MKPTIILCFLIFIGALNAQDTKMSYFLESRSIDEFTTNKTDLGLNVSGPEINKSKYLRVSKITKAVDDLGNNLIPDDNNYEYIETYDGEGQIFIQINNAARKANSIKEISGIINAFNPTEANGGIVKIKNIGTQTNKDLLQKEKDLTLIYFTKESFEKAKKDYGKIKEKELSKQPNEVQVIAKAIKKLEHEMEYIDWSYPQLNFIIDGDPRRIVSISLTNAEGEELYGGSYSYSEFYKTYYFDQEIKPNYTLNITLEIQGGIKSFPFSIKNIQLP